MQSKAAKRHKRRLLASMTDQQTPEAVRARVMELERLDTRDIAALPMAGLMDDETEMMARVQVMVGRMSSLARSPGGKEAMAEAFHNAGAEMRAKNASLLQRAALTLVGRFFTGTR